MKTKKTPKVILKCTRPDEVSLLDWKDCNKCHFSKCGYSRYYEPNPHWRDQGGICAWEHCIENYPISKNRVKISCPIFGHNCPDGIDGAEECREQLKKQKSKGRQKKKGRVN